MHTEFAEIFILDGYLVFLKQIRKSWEASGLNFCTSIFAHLTLRYFRTL